MNSTFKHLSILALIFGFTSASAQSDESYEKALLNLHEAQEKLQRATQKLYGDQPQSLFSRLSGRPKFGIVMSPAPKQNGIKISNVSEGSPADQAGIEPGDILLSINQQELDGSQESMQLAIDREAEDGDNYEITFKDQAGNIDSTIITAQTLDGSLFNIDRKVDLHQQLRQLGQLKQHLGNLNKELGQRYSAFTFPNRLNQTNTGPMIWAFGWRWSGLELAKLNPELGSYFQTNTGVLVISTDGLEDNSLKPGDVILSINSETVDSPETVMEELAWIKPGRTVEIEVIRRGEVEDISMVSPEEPKNAFQFDFQNGD